MYLRLHIVSPDEKGPFKVQVAKVRWIVPHRFGVEFLSFVDAQQVTVGRVL